MIPVLSWNVNRFRFIGSTPKLSYISDDWVFCVVVFLLYCYMFSIYLINFLCLHFYVNIFI